MPEPVVATFERKTLPARLVRAHGHVRSAPAAKRAEEVGLVGAVDTERVVARSRPRLLSTLSGMVFKHALVDDHPFAFDRPFK